MWQLAPGLRVLPWQLWKPEKGEPTPPPAPDITTGLGPTFVTVTVWLGALLPTCTGPKSRLVGVITNCAPRPFPLGRFLKFFPFQQPLEFGPPAPPPAARNRKPSCPRPAGLGALPCP